MRRILYCKGKIRTTLFAASFVRLAVHRLCNTRVLLHPLRGNPSQNLAAKSAQQSKAARRALRRGEARRPCRAHGQGLQQSMSALVSAFDRVRITPLQYISAGAWALRGALLRRGGEYAPQILQKSMGLSAGGALFSRVFCGACFLQTRGGAARLSYFRRVRSRGGHFIRRDDRRSAKSCQGTEGGAAIRALPQRLPRRGALPAPARGVLFRRLL